VDSALLAVLADNAWAVGAVVDSVTVADGCATSCTSTVDVVVDEAVTDGVVTALAVTECFESDPLLSAVDVDSVCGADVAGGVAGVAGVAGAAGFAGVAGVSVSAGMGGIAGVAGVAGVAVLWAPPLLLMMTPGATSVVDDVVLDVFVVSVAAVVVAVDVDALADVVDEEAEVPGVVVAADPAEGSPVDVVLEVGSAALDDDDSEDVPVVSAALTP
jgi:hypothetical protein